VSEGGAGCVASLPVLCSDWSERERERQEKKENAQNKKGNRQKIAPIKAPLCSSSTELFSPSEIPQRYHDHSVFY
jgi:hypothetical protein